MKNLLIAGAGSYIGTSFEAYLRAFPGQYRVDTADLKDQGWIQTSFRGYDSVLYVAGIVHIKERKSNAALFYRVNRDMAVEAAEKAKREGVKQFVYLSTMSVYGRASGAIGRETAPAPTTHYGRSKLQAEERLRALSGPGFALCVLRPPMVYGDGCKGNYRTLCHWARVLPAFPDVDNRRSMLRVDKLCAYLKKYVDDEAAGTFFPQDDSYVCTSRMVREAAEQYGRRLRLTRAFNPMIRFLERRGVRLAVKVFGSLYYTKDCER